MMFFLFFGFLSGAAVIAQVRKVLSGNVLKSILKRGNRLEWR